MDKEIDIDEKDESDKNEEVERELKDLKKDDDALLHLKTDKLVVRKWQVFVL